MELSITELLSMALEAEDITKETKKQNDRIDEGAPDRRASGIDMNTDDILGTKGGGDNDNPDETDTDDNNTDDETDDPDNDSEDTGDDTDSDTDDTGLDDSVDTDDSADTDNQEDTSAENQSNIKKKTELKKNIVTLYNMIKGNVETLSKYNPDNVETELYDKFFKIQTHLSNCRDMLFDLGTTSVNTDPYLISLKKYTTIKQVYDICILMLDRFYDAVKISNGLTEGGKKE